MRMPWAAPSALQLTASMAGVTVGFSPLSTSAVWASTWKPTMWRLAAARRVVERVLRTAVWGASEGCWRSSWEAASTGLSPQRTSCTILQGPCEAGNLRPACSSALSSNQRVPRTCGRGAGMQAAEGHQGVADGQGQQDQRGQALVRGEGRGRSVGEGGVTGHACAGQLAASAQQESQRNVLVSTGCPAQEPLVKACQHSP